MKKILYVEDNKDTADAVRVILTRAGYFIETVGNGRDCLMKAKNNFDLFLLDIMLPDMSGWAIFERLKNSTAKIAFLSAIPISQERRKELYSAGISEYITKPFTKETLIDTVEKILSDGNKIKSPTSD